MLLFYERSWNLLLHFFVLISSTTEFKLSFVDSRLLLLWRIWQRHLFQLAANDTRAIPLLRCELHAHELLTVASTPKYDHINWLAESGSNNWGE